ncbi:manganese-dependent inorganic pyrophosphatase [Aliicoccus persicus]|uniref:inorganic diphosphatase n=1 Tax=Aliicoccus persicus TaxID=930138 RepID=A0A662Z4M2_9STAP|nr:manganese-dependent inorganic pyrophosphatase [Aliicoccus persicus]SEW11481.1 manganese-dependent inorganic pyrophosphatase [Aliicoccus persicus]
MSIKIFGHQNPDTDTVTSALVLEYIERARGNDDVEAVMLGEIGEETAFALNYFGVDAPKIIDSVIDGERVMLVDHNEFQQSATNIENAEILKVYDHHRISNFETESPLYFRAEPVGCTATILYKVFKEEGLDIPKDMAGLMLSAVISDTLLFKSPTTTKEDEVTGRALADLAGVDVDTYGLEMLKAGASTKDKTAAELIGQDAKTFEVNEKNVRIAQINVVDVDEVFERRQELETAINAEVDREEYDLFILVVTNILVSDSKVLALGKDYKAVEAAFDVTLDDNTAILEGVVSRKKQVVPNITKALS